MWCRTGIDFTAVPFNERLVLPVVTDVDFSQNPETQSQKRGCTVLRVLGQVLAAPPITGATSICQAWSEVAFAVWGIDNEERVQNDVGADIGDIGPDTADWFDRDYFGWKMDGYSIRQPVNCNEEDSVITQRHEPMIRMEWDMQIRRRMSGDDNLFLAFQPSNSADNNNWQVAAYAQALIQLPG